MHIFPCEIVGIIIQLVWENQLSLIFLGSKYISTISEKGVARNLAQRSYTVEDRSMKNENQYQKRKTYIPTHIKLGPTVSPKQGKRGYKLDIAVIILYIGLLL